MKTKSTLCLMLLGLFTSFMLTAQVPERKGWWKFDDSSDLLKATIGSALTLEGTQESVSGPTATNLATMVPLGSYLAMSHGIAANGGGTLVNEWTLQIDFSVSQIDTWYAFFETTATTSDDADLFVAKTAAGDIGRVPNSIGCGSILYSANTISADTWYRMIVSVKNGEFFRIYINGELWLDSPVIQDVDGRYGLAPTIYIFQDGDGDDGDINCSELGIWDVALTTDQAVELGDATTSPTGIVQNSKINSLLGQNYPNPVTGFTTFNYQVNKPGNVSFSIVDYAGREVKQMNAGQKMAGSYKLELSADDLNNGIYFIRMNSGESTAVQKFTVNK